MSNPFAGTRELRFTDFTGGTDDCLDYASHTDTSSLYYAPLGSRAEVWLDDNVLKYKVEDTGATPDGYNVIKSVAGGYSGTLRWRLYGTTSSNSIPFTSQHSSWPDGLTDEEIFRVNLAAGEKARITRMELAQKGGGAADASLELSIAESTDGGSVWTELATTTSLSTGAPIATSTAGAILIVRMTNNTGAAKTCSLSVMMGII